jgi:hypothetical protein
MGGDAEAYSEGIERARAANVVEAQVAVFEAWHAAHTGADTPASLPAQSAPLLGTILEALLRVEEFEAFEKLVPLVDACPLPSRERHELLALIYLRRGFLESAADEWVAACQDQGPDARALVGLAQVAYAREMLDDAAVFASEATAMDPGNKGAAALLEALAPAV